VEAVLKLQMTKRWSGMTKVQQPDEPRGQGQFLGPWVMKLRRKSSSAVESMSYPRKILNALSFHPRK
jgi:hypothetical protein